MGKIEQSIVKAVEDKGKTLGWLAGEIGMSRSGFNKMLESETIKVSTLQKIADSLGVTISVFYGEDYIPFNNSFLQRNLYDKNVINHVITRLKNLAFLIEKNNGITTEQINYEINDIISDTEKAGDRYIELLLSTVSTNDKNKMLTYLEELIKEEPKISNIETALRDLFEPKPNQ